jgi:hypothetical protein
MYALVIKPKRRPVSQEPGRDETDLGQALSLDSCQGEGFSDPQPPWPSPWPFYPSSLKIPFLSTQLDLRLALIYPLVPHKCATLPHLFLYFF